MNKLNILCIYYDDEPEFLAQDPEVEFAEHTVVIANTYCKAKDLLIGSSHTFDIVLSDMWVPHTEKDTDEIIQPILLGYSFRDSVKGFGLFVPDYYETTFTDVFGPNKVVMNADRTCWTFDKRDWNQLLRNTMRAVDEFSTVPV